MFDDVPSAFQRWKEAQTQIYIYSSGSIEAQRLLFGHSVAGNLSKVIEIPAIIIAVCFIGCTNSLPSNCMNSSYLVISIRLLGRKSNPEAMSRSCLKLKSLLRT